MSHDEHDDGRPPDPALRDLAAVERWARDAGAPASAGPAADARYDVEAMTVDGMHQVVRSTGATVGGGEAGGQGEGAGAPCGEARPPNAEERAALGSVVRALLDLAGHESGPSRIGVAFTDGWPRIVAWDLSPGPACAAAGTAGAPATDAALSTAGPRAAAGNRAPIPGDVAGQRRSEPFPETGTGPGPLREHPPEP